MADYITIARETTGDENLQQKFYRAIMETRNTSGGSNNLSNDDIKFLYENRNNYSLYQKAVLFLANNDQDTNENSSIFEYVRETGGFKADGTINNTIFTDELIQVYLDYGAALIFVLDNRDYDSQTGALNLLEYLPFVEGELPNVDAGRTLDDIRVDSSGGKNRPTGDYLDLKSKYDARGEDFINDVVKQIANVYSITKDSGDLIAGGNSSLKKFSFSQFNREVAKSINEFLKTNPAIEMHTGIEYRTEASGKIYAANEPEFVSIPDIPERISPSEKKLLDETGIVIFPTISTGRRRVEEFLPKEISYKFPIANDRSLVNDIEVGEDLSSLRSIKGEDVSWYNIDDKTSSVLVNFYNVFYRKVIALRTVNIVADSVVENLLREEEVFPPDRFEIDLEDLQNSFTTSIALAYVPLSLSVAKTILRRLIFLFFKELADKINKGEATAEDLKKAFLNAEVKAKADEKITGKELDEEELTEEEIKARQKFLKQCMLMTNLSSLVDENIEFIKKKNSVHSEVPYGHRFYMIDDATDRSSIMNKLVIPSGETLKGFLDIKPHEHASLVPKLRFFKVTKDKDSEFKFPNVTSKKRIEALKSTVFDRGSDFGVKEFSFSFEGTNPATAKNDIKADLTLYFQSFKDFVEKKSFNDGKSYVELLLLPGGKKKGEVSGVSSPLHYAPSDYRIRVDVGWMLESAPNESIKKALKKINKSFYLNMIDHSIDFKNDGSVEIKVTYRAYIETQLKGSTLDALSSYESRESLEELNKVYKKIVNSNNCTAEELTQIRAQFLELEEGLRKQTYQSMLKRLLDRGLIRRKIVAKDSSSEYIEKGIFTGKVKFLPVADTTPPSAEADIASKASDKTVDIRKGKDIRNMDDTYNLNYFYLGDLLHVVLDCLYEKSDPKKYREDVQNFKFILSTFDYLDPFRNGTPTNINIANIPISVELFFEWITENVVKKDRVSYPVLYFIRDITKYLITEILLENCFNFSLEKSMHFKTTNFIGLKNKQGDPLASLATSKSPVIDVTDNYKKENSVFPLNADSEKTPQTKDFINYLVLYPETPRLRDAKTGKKKDDQENGVLHFQVGRDRGLVKTIKFSKTDMQYIREARFFRNGHDGLMQLSAVYKASLEMVGNTLFYPGVEIFLDPRGLLGAGEDFDPTRGAKDGQRSIANKLGFGGYHLITRVNSSIGPGKFTTTVDAMFDYAGDGDLRSRVIGNKEDIKDVLDLEKLEQRPVGGNKAYCDAVIDSLFNQSIDIANGTQSKFEISLLEDRLSKAGVTLEDVNLASGPVAPTLEPEGTE